MNRIVCETLPHRKKKVVPTSFTWETLHKNKEMDIKHQQYSNKKDKKGEWQLKQ